MIDFGNPQKMERAAPAGEAKQLDCFNAIFLVLTEHLLQVDRTKIFSTDFLSIS